MPTTASHILSVVRYFPHDPAPHNQPIPNAEAPDVYAIKFLTLLDENNRRFHSIYCDKCGKSVELSSDQDWETAWMDAYNTDNAQPRKSTVG
jgi:hypothetical protein